MKLHYKALFTVFSSVFLGLVVTGSVQAQIRTQAPPQPQLQQVQSQTQQPEPAAQLSVQQMEQVAEQSLKSSVENDFKELLSFPLGEKQMISYINAARRVQQINDKWDVQIASTESDKAAIEYNNYSIEEIMLSLQRIPGLTLDQYNEMTRLISSNKEFNRIYLAYKELVEQGRFKVDTPVDLPTVTQKNAAPMQDISTDTTTEIPARQP